MSQMDVPNAPDRQVTRDTWLLACVLIAMACLLAAVVAAGLAFRASDDASRAAKTGLAAGAKTAIAPTGSPQHVAVELGDLYIKPSRLRCRPERRWSSR